MKTDSHGRLRKSIPWIFSTQKIPGILCFEACGVANHRGLVVVTEGEKWKLSHERPEKRRCFFGGI